MSRRKKHQKRKRISAKLPRLCACVLGAALLVVPVLADTVGGAKVSTNDTGLNLRAQPTTSSGVLTVIPDGSFLLVEEVLDGWYKVVYNGRSGYVSSDYAVFSETLDGAYDYAAATSGTAVNLRAGAGTDTAVVRTLWSAGTPLGVTGVSGNWLKVRSADGADGYVRSDLMSYAADGKSGFTVFADDPVTVSEAVGEQLVATAKQYLGYNYKWGGMSPGTGFDCSGFTNYIYKLYGYSLSRVAQAIYNWDGVSVSADELRPGDILCFGYGGSVDHVGIYAGNGQMIHASSYDTGVILSDLAGHYEAKLVGAKRIIT